MDRAQEWAALSGERRCLEHDLAVGEWTRARQRIRPLLGRLLGACAPGGEEIESWMRILTCLAEIPPALSARAQLALWPNGGEGAQPPGPSVVLAWRARGGVAARMGVITQDARMLGALSLLEDLARTALPILLEGESGTGKEVVARGVHRSSRCADAAFIAVNCGALPGELHESELFGHARGAYTGAALEKPGLFEAAHGGSIFLDEIGEMDPRAQVKLLRVLESGELRRLGEIRTRQVKVRVIAATNARVDEAVAAGRFRRDLLHRVAAIRVVLPPLRERRGDILPLAEHFLRRVLPCPPALSPRARADLLRHDWPGNVRELKYAMERAAALWSLSEQDELRHELLFPDRNAECRSRSGEREFGRPADLDEQEKPGKGEGRMQAERATKGRRGADADAEYATAAGREAGGQEIGPQAWPDELPRGYTIDKLFDDIERRLIARALAVAEGNRTAAALLLGGLSRTTLVGKMKRLGLSAQAPGKGSDPAAGGATGEPPADGRTHGLAEG